MRRRRRGRGHALLPPVSREQAMAKVYAHLEALARDGFATQGRGFVFYAMYPDRTSSPFVQYLTLDDPAGAGFIPSAPDLVALVRTYDPQASFVVFEGTLNRDQDQLEHVRIAIWSFLRGPTLVP